jgi:hypothetical protein
MTVCDTISVDGGGGNGGQNESELRVSTVEATIGSEPDTVDVKTIVSNDVVSGDGKYIEGTVTVDTGFDTWSIDTSIGAGTAGTFTQSFTGAPDGEHTVTVTADWPDGSVQGDDTVVVDTSGGGGGGTQDSSRIVVENITLSNPSDNTLTVDFSIANEIRTGSGETLDANYEISLDGRTEESGLEPSLSPDEIVDLSFEFTGVSSGDVGVTISTDDDSMSDSINVSGGGGGGDQDPVEGGSPLDGIPKKYLLGGVALAAVAVGSRRGGGYRPSTRRRNGGK